MGGNDDIAKYWKGTAAWMNNSVKTRTNYNKTHTHTMMNVFFIKFREVTLWTLKLHNIPNVLQVRVIYPQYACTMVPHDVYKFDISGSHGYYFHIIPRWKNSQAFNRIRF
jgi:hypothetical protein